MNNVIPTGTSPEAPFCVYGDESRFRNILVFAFAVFHRRDRDRAQDVLSAIRDEYRIPSGTPIHCRILYNADARKKNGLNHLDQPTVDALVGAVVNRMNDVPTACRFAWTALPDRNPLLESSDPSWELPNEPKGVLGMLMQACFAVAADGHEGPAGDQSEIFVSADPTKIGFLGKNKYQAHRGSARLSWRVRLRRRTLIPITV